MIKKYIKKIGEELMNKDVIHPICPKCQRVIPPEHQLYTCDECNAAFNTFRTKATCPKCGKVFKNTQCPLCLYYSPFNEWRMSL